MTPSRPGDQPWPATLAHVTSCEYQFGSLSVMAFGIPDRNHFRITFTYIASGNTYTGQFTSPTAIAHGETFPVTYNPAAPQVNNKSRLLPGE